MIKIATHCECVCVCVNELVNDGADGVLRELCLTLSIKLILIKVSKPYLRHLKHGVVQLHQTRCQTVFCDQ